MHADLCDVCGCRGAGGFRGDGLGAQQHPGVCVTISVDLLIRKDILISQTTLIMFCPQDGVQTIATVD